VGGKWEGIGVAGNAFRSEKYRDHEILGESGSKVGDVRVKPSGILWSPKGKHTWYRVSLDDFATFLEKSGEEWYAAEEVGARPRSPHNDGCCSGRLRRR